MKNNVIISKMTMKNLILASSSSYKQQQFAQLQVDFDCIPADIDESPYTNEHANALAQRLALAKANKIADLKPDATIIGCDQSAECNASLLSKPLTEARAIQQLSLCSGQTATFYSAVAIVNKHSGLVRVDTTRTLVRFRELSQKEIRYYVEHEHVLDCAGSFKCEGLGISLFSSINSDDPSALIGLPLIALNRLMLESGINALEPS